MNQEPESLIQQATFDIGPHVLALWPTTRHLQICTTPEMVREVVGRLWRETETLQGKLEEWGPAGIGLRDLELEVPPVLVALAGAGCRVVGMLREGWHPDHPDIVGFREVFVVLATSPDMWN